MVVVVVVVACVTINNKLPTVRSKLFSDNEVENFQLFSLAFKISIVITKQPHSLHRMSWIELASRYGQSDGAVVVKVKIA